MEEGSGDTAGHLGRLHMPVTHLEGSHPLLLRQTVVDPHHVLISDQITQPLSISFEFYWKLTWTLERYQAKQCWFRDDFPGEWKPLRGSDWSHLWAKRTKEKKGKTNRFWKTCKEALSRNTGQWKVMVIEMSHSILIQVKPINSRPTYQHQSSPIRSQVGQKPLSRPQLALEGWTE